MEKIYFKLENIAAYNPFFGTVHLVISDINFTIDLRTQKSLEFSYFIFIRLTLNFLDLLKVH